MLSSLPLECIISDAVEFVSGVTTNQDRVLLVELVKGDLYIYGARLKSKKGNHVSRGPHNGASAIPVPSAVRGERNIRQLPA